MKHSLRIKARLVFYMIAFLCFTSVVSGTTTSQSRSNVNNQATQPMGASHVVIPPRSQEIPIPADGDCLYKSIMMAYLLPVVNDADLFNVRLAMLIRQDTIIPTEKTKTDKDDEKKYDSKMDINQVWDAVQIRQNFLNLRRSTLVYCLRQYPFPTFVPYMRTHMGIKKKLWGGTREIQKIADKLQVNIEEYTPNPEDNNNTLAEPIRIQPKQKNALLTLRIVRDNPTNEEAVDNSKDWQTQLIQYHSAQDAQHRQHYRALLTPIPNFLLGQNNLSFTTFKEGTNKDNQPKKLFHFVDDKVIQRIIIDKHSTLQKAWFTSTLLPLIVPAGETVMLPSRILYRYSYIKLGRNASITTNPYNPETQQGGRLTISCYGACILEEGARIHVNGCGHPGRPNGAGYGDGGGEGGIYCAGGGSYRTRGSLGKCIVNKQQHKALSGNTYNAGYLHIKSKLPLGSAGGAICFMRAKPNHSLPGARGGGALSITIDGTLQLGKKSGFQANGQDGSSSTGGAGSGGTLMLLCKGGIQMPDGPTNLLSVSGGQSLGKYRLARGSGGLGYSHLDYQYSMAPKIKLPYGLACLLTYWTRENNIKKQTFLSGWIGLFMGYNEQPTSLVDNRKDSNKHCLAQEPQTIANYPYVDDKLQTLPNSKAIYIDYLYETGNGAYQQKKYGQAIRYYQQALQNITQQPPTNDGSFTITKKGCYLKIAEAYVAQGNYTKATQAYQKAGQKAQSIEEALALLERAQQKEIEMNYLAQQGLSIYIPLHAVCKPMGHLNKKVKYLLTDYIAGFMGQFWTTQDEQDKDDAKDDEKKDDSNDDVPNGLYNKGQFLSKLQERLRQTQVLLLQGTSGAGKSLSGRYITAQYKSKSKDKKITWVAVFISLPSTYSGAHLLTEALMDKGLDLLTIHSLQQSSAIRILFVLDGFDEIITSYRRHANLPDKVSDRFGFHKWPGSKFIISFCSQEITDSDKYQYLGIHPAVHLMYFTQQQIKQYIAAFAQSKSLNIAGWSVQRYKRVLSKLPRFNDMMRQPFLLGLILNVLPYLSYEKVRSISRAELYEAFIDQWFQRQISKLKKNERINIPTATLKQTFQTYCEELALAMFKSGKQVMDVAQENKIWRAFFTKENRLSLQGSPLCKVGGDRYMFIHKSYQAYFVASRFIHNLLCLPKYQSQWASYNFAAVDWNQKSYQAYFNNDAAVVGFMIDRLHDADKRYGQLEKLLFAIIEYSKQNQKVAVLSANSATLLCAARLSLSYKKWSGICIPYAKLDQALLTGTDLSHSDCTGVSLRHAYLERTRWQGAKVHGINFWAFPYLEHDDRVNVVVYSPNGRYIASASDDMTVRIWDGQNGRFIVTCSGHTDKVYSVAWSQDSLRLASASLDNTVRIWDGQNGNPIATCTGHTEYVNSVAWSKDSRYIASASWDKTVRIWGTKNGKSITTCIGHTGGVTSVTWSQDSRRIASASYDHTVRIWDGQSGETITTCTGHTSYIYSVVWSQDNLRIASASYDNTVRIWDGETGKSIATCTGHTGAVLSVAWSHDSLRIASASWDKTVCIWDGQNGNKIATCTGHTEYVNSVAWAHDNKIASASYDKTVRIWKGQDGNKIAVYTGHTGYVYSVAWSQDSGRIASASADMTVRIWNTKNRKSIATCYGHVGRVKSVAWSQDSRRIASTSYDKTVRIWDARNGNKITTCKGHTEYVYSVAWSQDGRRIASASKDKTVRIWDATTGKSIAICTGHVEGVISVAWAQESDRIVSASRDKTVRIWDAQSGRAIATCARHTGVITSVAWSQDSGRIASASRDKTVRIWDGQSGSLIAICKGHTSTVTSVTWSKSSNRIASGSWDKTVRIWDAPTGKSIATCTGHTKRVTSVTWSQDSRIASASRDKTVRIWDGQNGKSIAICSGHTDWVGVVVWSHDSRRIASAGWDNTVRIWDTTTGKSIAICSGHTKQVKSIAWSKDNRIASTSHDKTVRIWDGQNGHILYVMGMEHVRLTLTNAHFGGAIGLSDTNKQLIQQCGGRVENKKDDEKKDEV